MDASTILPALKQENVAVVVQYGSSLISPESANDIDLLAIYNENQCDNFQVGKFDVIRLTQAEFDWHRDVLDPIHCTEPCLTGEVLYGDDEWLTAVSEQLISMIPHREAIRHNLREAMIEYQKTVRFLDRDHIAKALRSLSFSISHWAFANWYADENPPAEVDRVVGSSEATQIFQEVIADAKAFDQDESVSKVGATRRVEEWEDWLLSSEGVIE
jgi:hypothetical protein